MSLRRFRPYYRYLKANRGPLLAAIGFGIVYGISSGAGLPAMVKYVFPRIFEPEGAPMEMGQVALIALAIPIVFLIRGASGYLNSYLFQLTGTRVLEAIRLDYFRKVQLLPLSFLQRRQSGDLISRGLADATQLQTTLIVLANDGLKQPMQLVGALVFLGWQAYSTHGVLLMLLCLATVPLTVLPIRYVGRKIVKRAEQLQSQLGDLTSHFTENIAAAREVRAFSLESREIQRFNHATTGLVHAQMRIAKYAQALTPAIEVLAAVGIGLTLVVAFRSAVSLSTFTAVVTALYFCYEPIKKLGTMNNELKRGEASLNRLEYVLHEPLAITDPADPVSVGRLRGDIAFDRVSFSYGDNAALRDVTVRIPAGTCCALVGPSGAGKTTFANLVPRFYEVAEGSVSIDGHDVRRMRLADLRRNIAVVSQDPVLFNDSIYQNLLLGRPDASQEDVLAAARAAHADEFIRGFPAAYDTSVGERGALLSGGQKQRIAIARAFLRNAPILILDEATSALDSESEAAIQDALRTLVAGKTVLVIAHRFSTIRDATMILVFDQGRIVGQGDHLALLEGNPLYRSLHERQSA